MFSLEWIEEVIASFRLFMNDFCFIIQPLIHIENMTDTNKMRIKINKKELFDVNFITDDDTDFIMLYII
jgi:hypothetical protein